MSAPEPLRVGIPLDVLATLQPQLVELRAELLELRDLAAELRERALLVGEALDELARRASIAADDRIADERDPLTADLLRERVTGHDR